MAKTKISEFSATPANNTDIDSINIAEGCAPSGINDAIRELMAQLKDFQTGAVGDSFNGPIGTTTAAAGAFTTLSSTGNTTLGDASGDAVTVNGTATFANANPTLTAGTANGVTYLNGSKVLTSGSALTYNGTSLGIGSSSYGDAGSITASIGVAGTTAGGLQLWASSAQEHYIQWGDSTTGSATYAGAISYAHSTDSMRFWTGSTERLRITSTGDVGIGTSSPSSYGTKLAVSGAANVYGDERKVLAVIDTTSLAAGVGAGVSFFGVSESGGGVSQFGSIKGIKENATSGNYAGALAFVTSNSANAQTERMRLDSAGNVGIGTSSPNSKLTVTGGQARILSSTAFASNPLDNGSWSGAITVNTNDGAGDLSGIGMYVNSSYGAGCGIFAKQTSSTTAALTFFTGSGVGASNVERARINSDGEFLVGTTTNAGTTVGSRMFPTGLIQGTRAESTNATTQFDLYSTGASAYRFYVGMGGTIYATSTTITAISDQRLKENIRDLDEGLATVMALKPRKFDWKEGKGQNIKNARGFIAQEFETVLPDMIETWRDSAPEGEEAYKAINANLIPTLVKAMQEQQALIQSLTARLDAANL